jgi:2-polyprenyl-6-methoxyphenol hydroxylase-like FAD-dependent oxidoreductase
MGRVDAPVVIVGGGPTGLALALGLARHGVSSIVLEDHAQPTKLVHCAALAPRTLEILSHWGVLADAERQGLRQRLLHAWHIGADRESFKLDLADLPSAEGHLLLLPQFRAQKILQERACATGLVEIRRGHKVVGLQQDAQRVRLKVVCAEAEITYTLYSRYAVGCDGRKSAVRKLLGIGMRGKASRLSWVVADIRADVRHDTLAWPRFFYEARQLHVATRLSSGLWRTMVSFTPGVNDAALLDDAAVLSRAQALLSDCAQSFRIEWKAKFRLHPKLASHFRRGRVLLAGDAAHVSCPVGGQGMNLGVADAHNLAWKLSHALRRGSRSAALLSSYELERREAVGHSQRRLQRLCALLSLPLPGLLMRGLWQALGWILQRPWAQQQLQGYLGMLNTAYPHSPLFFDHHALVGRRAPDAPLVDVAGRRAHFNSRHKGAALLLFEGAEKSRAASLLTAAAIAVQDVTFWRILAPQQSPRTAAALSDVTGNYWKRWGAHPGMIVLIRPDGHVGFVLPQTPASVAAACILLRRALGLGSARHRRLPAVTPTLRPESQPSLQRLGTQEVHWAASDASFVAGRGRDPQ